MNDGYVTALYEAGVFIGTKVGDLTYFYPNSSITRAEVATIVYRIYQLSSLDQKQKIYYKDYTLDVLEGVPTNSYNKNAFVKNGSIMTYNDPVCARASVSTCRSIRRCGLERGRAH